jgi:hypothetical protein
MLCLPCLLLMFANPFWLEKMPADWTDIELSQIFVDSPWTQALGPPARAAFASPSVQLYLATAAPMAEAEEERAKRLKARRKPGEKEEEDPLGEDYQAWLEDNRASQIVVAVRLGFNQKLFDGGEMKRMEEESYMQVGRKKVKMSGHFPPTPRDPYLRIAFPRQPLEDEKTVLFFIYVPGLPLPMREVQFKVKDLMVNGKPEL